MSLVTKSRNADPASPSSATLSKVASKSMLRDADANRKRARTLAKQQQVAERVAGASNELATGINEAAAAAEELKRAADEIAGGAEEASGAAQESLAAITQIAAAMTRQLEAANAAQARADAVKELTSRANGEVRSTVENVTVASRRQADSTRMVAELERQAANIGDIVKAVGRIADQTNLLALNAAIEAARAGKHGKGFAVVADEVRTLAETSEKSAKQIQDLVVQIQGEVKVIAETINTSSESIAAEVEKSQVILQQLDHMGNDIAVVVEGAVEIAAAAGQGRIASQQALKGAEAVAAAALEQSQACEEASKTVEEQGRALAECEQTAKSLAEIADDLKNSTDIAKSAEEVASAAEELSSAVQEISRSANQIMVALDQINKGAQTQSSATTEAAAAITQIEKGAQVAEQRAMSARERATSVQALMDENKQRIDGLVGAIGSGVESTRTSIRQIKELELVSRRIDKIVDAINQVSIQTNMLAVNGAIEAARAGEYGKGFVVVATDIRNLAHDSAENADRIKDLVKSVQDQIGLVGRDLQEIIVSALSEVEKTRQITAMMNTIEADMGTIVAGNTAAVAASQEIATALAQVKIGVDQIATAATEASKASEQSAAAARQQSQSAEEMSAAIEEIASLADELQSA